WEFTVLAMKINGCLLGPFFDEGLALLLVIEQLVDLVGQLRLMPEDVAGVVNFFIEAAGSMAVENRAAEGDAFGAVAVGTQRHVPAGHDELELVAAGFAEDGDALVFAPLLAARVVL